MKRDQNQRSVRIAFEPTRFAREHLSDSYEKVTPLVSTRESGEKTVNTSKRHFSKLKKGENQ